MQTGAFEEIEFWKKFVLTDQFRYGWLDVTRPCAELLPEVVTLIQDKGGKVLDVGSGVVSILHSVVPRHRLTAVDLLANEYKMFFNYWERRLEPPQAMAAEDLPYQNEFDVVHCRNALDHCADPSMAWRRLKAAVRPGGLLIISTFENEGSHLRGLGMHLWDLFLHNRQLMLRNYQTMQVEALEPGPFEIIDPTGVTPLPATLRRWITWVGEAASV